MRTSPESSSDAPAVAGGAVAVEPRDTDERRVGTRLGGILAATKGGPAADAAVRLATALADRGGVMLHLLAVVEPLPALPSEYPTSIAVVTFERDELEETLARARERALTVLDPQDVVARMVVGPATTEIPHAAREWGARLIVIGAGRHGRLDRLVGGETAVRVIRHADVPVLTVPSSSTAAADVLPRVAVAAVDFGAASADAAREAAALLEEGGTLHLVHVRPALDLPATDPEAWAEVYETGARALLDELAAELATQRPTLRIETCVRIGHPAEQTLALAQSAGADLIAVGRHGHTAVERFFIGSIPTALVRAARCAVLVAPPARRDATAGSPAAHG